MSIASFTTIVCIRQITPLACDWRTFTSEWRWWWRWRWWRSTTQRLRQSHNQRSVSLKHYNHTRSRIIIRDSLSRAAREPGRSLQCETADTSECIAWCIRLLRSFRWYSLHLPTQGWPGWVTWVVGCITYVVPRAYQWLLIAVLTGPVVK